MTRKSIFPKPVLLSFLLAISTILLVWAYLPSLDGVFIYDDYDNILNAPKVWVKHLSCSELAAAARSFAGNRPLARLTFGLNYYFSQRDPWSYHLVNLFIHVLSFFLLVLFACKLLQLTTGHFDKDQAGEEQTGGMPDLNRVVACFAALIWAVHPHNVQAVTYIVQRMAAMSALFSLAAVYAYIQCREKDGWAGLAWGIFAFLSMFLGLLSKENAAITPLLCLAVEFFVFQKGDLDFVLGNKKRIFFILAVLLMVGALTLVLNIPGRIGSWFGLYLDNKPIQGLSKGFTPFQRLLTEPRVLLLYLFHFFWPKVDWFCLDHYPELSRSLFHPPTTFLAIAGGVLLLFIAWKVRRRYPLLSLAVYWYFLAHFIESAAPALDIMYDHRMYLPSMLIPLAVLDLGRRFFAGKRHWFSAGCLWPGIFLVVLVSFLGFQAWRYNYIWQSATRIWRHNVQLYPNDIRPKYNLADALLAAGQYEQAKKMLQACLLINDHFSLVYYDLATLAVRDQDFSRAEQLLSKALELFVRNKQSISKEVVKAMALMSYIQANLGHKDRALELAEKIDYSIWPVPQTFDFLAKAMLAIGKFDLAARFFSLGAKYHPEKKRFFEESAAVFALQGNRLVRDKQYEEALRCYREAIKLHPLPVFYEGLMGIAWAKGYYEQAIAYGQKGLGLDPHDEGIRKKFVRFCKLYGDTLRRQGKTGQAVYYYRQALKIDPDNVRLLNNLAWWLATAPEVLDLPKARAIAERADRLSSHKDAYVLDTLAEICLRLGDKAKAREVSLKALSLALAQNRQDVVQAVKMRLKSLDRSGQE